MNKAHHPHNKAERRRLNRKKDIEKSDRAGHVQKRLAQEALEQKEALDEFRREIHATESAMHRNGVEQPDIG